MKTALITGKISVPHLKPTFHKLQQELLNLGIDSFIIGPHDLPNQDFDIVFTIGGDGSFLGAARKYVDKNIPIVPIKGGTVGFLPNLDPKQLDKQLAKILSPSHKWTSRMMLTGITNKQEKLIALNEFLFSSERKGLLSEFSVYINNRAVMTVRADALIIASPTGSTAYNLSAGGPISLPDMELLTITPVCSHILGERPLVIGLNNKIHIVSHSDGAKIWADGQDAVSFEKDNKFEITQPIYIKSLKTNVKDFFHSLSRKLGWRSGIKHSKI